MYIGWRPLWLFSSSDTTVLNSFTESADIFIDLTFRFIPHMGTATLCYTIRALNIIIMPCNT